MGWKDRARSFHPIRFFSALVSSGTPQEGGLRCGNGILPDGAAEVVAKEKYAVRIEKVLKIKKQCVSLRTDFV